jgi:hypothetical protein
MNHHSMARRSGDRNHRAKERALREQEERAYDDLIDEERRKYQLREAYRFTTQAAPQEAVVSFRPIVVGNLSHIDDEPMGATLARVHRGRGKRAPRRVGRATKKATASSSASAGDGPAPRPLSHNARPIIGGEYARRIDRVAALLVASLELGGAQ